MKLSKSLLKLWVKSGLEYFSGFNWARIVVVFSFSLVLIIFVIGIYFFFLSIFSYLASQTFSEPLNLFVLIAAFFLFFFFAVFSNIISGISVFFKGGDLRFLFSTPTPLEGIFIYKTVVNWVLGSWALFVLGIPTLVAYGVQYSATPLFFVISFISLLMLTLVASFIGVPIALIMVRLFGRMSLWFLVLFLALIVVPLGFILANIILPSDFWLFLKATDVASMYVYLLRFNAFSSFLPSSWMVQLLLSYLVGDFGRLLSYLLLLTVSCLGLFAISISIAKKWYFLGWEKFQEGNLGIFREGDLSKKKPKVFPAYFKGKMGALLEKDFLHWKRNPSELLQFTFLLLLFSVYFFALGRIPNFSRANVEIVSFITVFNVVVVGYLLTILALRFVFPLISLEGRSLWIIKSAPIPIKIIFWEKFVFSFLLCLLASSIMILVTGKLLHLDSIVFTVSALVLSIISLTVTSIALGFGAAFPNFKGKDSEILSTSPAGILTTLLCLGYIAVVAVFLLSNFPSYFALVNSGGEGDISYFWFAIGTIFFVSIFLSGTILLFGERSLSRHEFSV